jgi:hypothetical protein
MAERPSSAAASGSAPGACSDLRTEPLAQDDGTALIELLRSLRAPHPGHVLDPTLRYHAN